MRNQIGIKAIAFANEATINLPSPTNFYCSGIKGKDSTLTISDSSQTETYNSIKLKNKKLVEIQSEVIQSTDLFDMLNTLTTYSYNTYIDCQVIGNESVWSGGASPRWVLDTYTFHSICFNYEAELNNNEYKFLVKAKKEYTHMELDAIIRWSGRSYSSPAFIGTAGGTNTDFTKVHAKGLRSCRINNALVTLDSYSLKFKTSGVESELNKSEFPDYVDISFEMTVNDYYRQFRTGSNTNTIELTFDTDEVINIVLNDKAIDYTFEINDETRQSVVKVEYKMPLRQFYNLITLANQNSTALTLEVI